MDLKEHGWALDFLDNLYRMYLVSQFSVEENEELRAQFETCIKFMNSQGLIKQLSFGNSVLLKPELLDYYASALINAVNDEPDGLGSILQDRVVEGDFPIPKDNRFENKEQERLLLVAMIELLQDHDIALREYTNDGSYLVFPSLSTRELSEATELAKKEVIFSFEGPVLNIYATLAVRLSHSSFFKKKEVGKDTITFGFTNPLGNPKEIPSTYGLSLHNIGEGRGELILSFNEDASNERRLLFEQFVHDHLLSRALPRTIQRIPICRRCGESFTESAIRRRQERGFSTIKCSVCESVVSIHTQKELDPAIYQTLISAMNSAANAQREREKNITIRYGESLAKISKGEYDVFLCYNQEDEDNVKKIRKELMNSGIASWDIWEIQPGKNRKREIGKQIENMSSAAVFVGESGIGPWQYQEIEALLEEFVRRNCSVIPVFLENAPDKLEVLPTFLRNFQEVNFRKPEHHPYSRPDIELEQEKFLKEALERGEALQAKALESVRDSTSQM